MITIRFTDSGTSRPDWKNEEEILALLEQSDITSEHLEFSTSNELAILVAQALVAEGKIPADKIKIVDDVCELTIAKDGNLNPQFHKRTSNLTLLARIFKANRKAETKSNPPA